MPKITRLFAAYRLELRLICLQWGYGLLYALWIGFVITNFGNASFQQSAGRMLFSMSSGLIPLLTLAVMMLSAISASRVRRIGIEPLEAAYPTGSEVIIGRWLALMTASSAFLIAPLSTALIVGPLDDFLRTLPLFLWESLTVIAVISIAIWLLQITLGIKRWMYPLFAVVWLGSAIVPTTLNVEYFPISLLLAFTAQGWLNMNVSDLWGRLTLGNLPLFYNVFYFALIILIIGLLVWYFHRERFYRNLWGAAVISGLALIFMLIAGRGYSLEVATVHAQINQQTQSMFTSGRVFTLPEQMPFYVRKYEITLDLTDRAIPRFEARIEAVNRGESPLNTLTFSLNDQLTITASDLPYQRDSAFISFTLPEALMVGASTTFLVRYEGLLWYYDGSYIVGRPLEVNSFIHPDGINLACSVAWYPVPGHIQVGRIQVMMFGNGVSRNYPDCILDEPAAFTIRLENAVGLHFASNLPQTDETTFIASRSTWAHVLGAPKLVMEQISPDVTLITAEPLLQRSSRVVKEHYFPALQHLRRFFPKITELSVIVTNNGFGNVFDRPATPITDGRLIVVLNPFYLTAIPHNPFNDYLFNGQAMVNSLFGLGESFESTYVENIGYFLWAHYMAAGDPDIMRVI